MIQDTALLPTAQQIQALLQMACENSPNLPTASPTNILISLLLLLNQISSMNADAFGDMFLILHDYSQLGGK